MSTSQINLKESYILSSSKEEFFGSLVKNSDTYLSMRAIYLLNTYGYSGLSPEHKKELEAFLNASNSISDDEKMPIKFKILLERLDTEADPQERKALLDNMKEIIGCNFDYSKPRIVKDDKLLGSARGEEIPDTISEVYANAGSLEEASSKFFAGTSISDVNNFTALSLNQIDLERLLDKSHICFEKACDSLRNFVHVKNMPKLLKKYCKAKSTSRTVFSLPMNYYNKLTLEQLQELMKILPSVKSQREFVSAHFKKHFRLAFGMLPTESENPRKRREIFVEMLNWLKEVSIPFGSFKSQIIVAILDLGIQLEDYDRDLFIEYLNSPRSTFSCFSNYNNQRLEESSYLVDDPYWYSVHTISNLSSINDAVIFETYLLHFFKSMNSIGEFEPYFESSYLQRLFFKSCLLRGENVEQISSYFNDCELDSIKEETILRFSKTNPTRFKAGDQVKIKMHLKNIKNLTVNIFEINPESYYRKHSRQIASDIKLTGLLPSTELTYEFSESSIVKIDKEFEFEDISKKERGVFIIELVGGGLNSRLVIRKGALTLVTQNVKSGVIMYIINEEKEICKGDQAKIVYNGKEYIADESGRIVMPFGERESTSSAILIYKNYAELINLTIPCENYEFQASLLFNEESICPGQSTKFLVQPKLFCSGKMIPLKCLKEVNAEIISTNNVGVKSNRKYRELELNYEKDLVLSYMIPSKTSYMEIKLSAKVYNNVQNKDITLNWSTNISVQNHENKQLLYNSYVRNTSKGYSIQLLGKNGEPLSGFTYSINLTSKYMIKKVSFNLKTNALGEVHLGKLEHYVNFTANLIDAPYGSPASININLISSDVISSLPSEFNIVEGEELCLPANSKTFSEGEYSIAEQSSSEGNYFADQSSKLRQEGQHIFVGGLTKGTYIFCYLRHYQLKTLTVIVHEGQRWDNEGMYLVKENEIMRLDDQLGYLIFTDLENKEGTITLKAMSNRPTSLKAHVIGFNHHPTSLKSMIDSLKGVEVVENVSRFELKRPKNSFFDEKTLSDEVKYVLERKRKNRFMGNTLEKPSGLLKRHFKRKTDAENISLERGANYKDRTGQILASVDRVGDLGISRGEYSTSFNIEKLNLFLQNKGEIIANCKPNNEGKFEIDVSNLKYYGTLLLVVEDSRKSLTAVISNEETELHTTDISLSQSKQAEKVYQYDRAVKRIPEGQEVYLEDLTSAEMSMVEDIPTLYNLLKLISDNIELADWEFLGKWLSLDPKEKLIKYDKFISHELNLYVYFKDAEFFDIVAKPHIQNKAEKQLIDYFLLGDHSNLEKYLAPRYLNQGLNYLEVSLLLLAFRDTRPEICRKIVNYYSLVLDQLDFDEKIFKKNFDTVLTAQQSQQLQVEDEKFEFDGHLNMMSNTKPQLSQSRGMGQERFRSLGMMQQQVMQQPMMQQQVMNNLMQMSNMEAPTHMFGGIQPCSSFGGGDSNTFAARGAHRGLRAQAVSRDVARASNQMLYMNECDDDMVIEQSDIPRIQSYQNAGATNEYVEKQYYMHTWRSSTEQSLRFWNEVFIHIIERGVALLPEFFTYASTNLTEMIAVICFTDLPEKKKEHETDNSNGFKLKAASNCLMFLKEMVEKGNQAIDLDIMISQKFFDPKDIYTVAQDGRSRMFKKVDNFVVGNLYGSRITITNSSESEHEVQVITEIPQGAIPVLSMEYSKSTTIKLSPLTTQLIEFNFYFPKVGSFTCYPASINKNGFMVTKANIMASLNVTKETTTNEMATLNDILSSGDQEDILTFIKTQNLHNSKVAQMNDIYWLFKNKDFYTKAIEILKDRMYFDRNIWAFAFLHDDKESMKEYLAYSVETDNFGTITRLMYLNTPMLNIDAFKFKEYNPLINPRVHDIGKHKQNIYNKQFKETYLEFLNYVVEKKEPSIKDYVYLCLYFLLQDRIDECLVLYTRIDEKHLESTDLLLQYKYLSAYLDLYSGFPKFEKARQLCEEFLTYPVFTWRNRFIDLANQIAEFDGEVAIEKEGEDDSPDAKNKDAVENSEYIGGELEDGKIKITCKNLESYSISYYKIDLEILFSEDPFLSVESSDFSFVKPTLKQEKTCEKTADYITLYEEIPHALKNSNMLIQLTSNANSENLTYFPSSMKIFMLEKFGQIKVASLEGVPLSKVYIKCFSRSTSGVKSFHKDGYTDLRGTFDYSSLNLENDGSIEKFAILVSSDEYGALLKEAKPPKAPVSKEGKILDLKSKKWKGTHMQQLGSKAMMNKYMM